MKKALLYLLFAVSIFSSCKKDDASVFDKSPDDRLNEKLAAYQSQLTGAVNGWKAIVSPGSGGTYFFYFKFNDQNRVKMYSTFDSISAVTPGESSYRLKALQQPSILFDTYSYLHVLSDPNESFSFIRADINGGPVGVGLESDFEYYFDSTSTDTIHLTGRFNKSKATFIRATRQEADAFDNKELGKSFLFRNIDKYLNYFKRVTIGTVSYGINVNQTLRTITFTWIDGSGNLRTFTSAYFYAATGISLVNPLVNGTQTITGFTNITWDPVNIVIGFTVNGTATTVTGVNQPVRADLDSPRRWWQFSVTADDFWLSPTGFHINGVDDAYNFSSVAGFNFLLFWARYSTSGGVNYDLLAPIVSRTLSNGAAFRPPIFTSDGRVIFSLFGTLGTINTNLQNTMLKMADPIGYYLVQTGPLSYDMVNAGDSKVWITWIF